MKNQKKRNKRSVFVITCLFLTTFLTLKMFKRVNYQDITIFGSELISIEDIISNSSLTFPTPLIFIKTKYIEKELRKNLSLENISLNRQILPFGLKIILKQRTPIAYGERLHKGNKITGFIDEDGFFINEKYSEKENLKKLSSRVFGWKEKYRGVISTILKFQKDKNVEFVRVDWSLNDFLILEEKSLSTILLGTNSKIIESQLDMIYDIKKQLEGRSIIENIDTIDLTDINNPKIKVFKP